MAQKCYSISRQQVYTLLATEAHRTVPCERFLTRLGGSACAPHRGGHTLVSHTGAAFQLRRFRGPCQQSYAALIRLFAAEWKYVLGK